MKPETKFVILGVVLDIIIVAVIVYFYDVIPDSFEGMIYNLFT